MARERENGADPTGDGGEPLPAAPVRPVAADQPVPPPPVGGADANGGRGGDGGEPVSFADEVPSALPPRPPIRVFNMDEAREGTRADLAKRLVWLLVVVVVAAMMFVGMGILEGAVVVQSVLPSIVALTGTALGFYFGTHAAEAKKG